jgi:hypothetical protein
MTRPQFTPFPKIPPVKLADMPIKPARMQAYQDRSLVHSSRLGKVYRMSVDNMLCLVPDANKTAPMPVKKTRMPEPMPNAYSRNRRF